MPTVFESMGDVYRGTSFTSLVNGVARPLFPGTSKVSNKVKHFVTQSSQCQRTSRRVVAAQTKARLDA
jgi:hypothetical protein